jgi:hypothetical protein
MVSHSSASGLAPLAGGGLGALSISGQLNIRNQIATIGPTMRSGSCSALSRPSSGLAGSEKPSNTMNSEIKAPT